MRTLRNYTCKTSNSRRIVLELKRQGLPGPNCKDLTFTRKKFSSYLPTIPMVGHNVVCKRKTTRWTTEWIPVGGRVSAPKRRR